MRNNILYVLFALLLLVFIVLISIRKEVDLIIITSPSNYSISSNKNDGFVISILTNKHDSYYFDTEYISFSELNNNSDQMISVEVNEVLKDDALYIYEGTEYYFVHFEISFSVGTFSDIVLSDMHFKITYINDKELSLYIGELYYKVYVDNDDLSLGNLVATHSTLEFDNTVTGVYIELYNATEYTIYIQSLHLPFESIYFDNFFLRELYQIPNITDQVYDILLLDNYDHFKEYTSYKRNYTLPPKQYISLYVPIIYNSKISILRRFPISVSYMYKNQEKEFVIDDFPFISKSMFNPEEEGKYMVYYFEGY